MPQLFGSFVRFLQAIALGAVEQHAVPAPLHALWRQSVSAQSMVPSQSLSTPSPQLVSEVPPSVEQLHVPDVQVDVLPHCGFVPHLQVPAEQVSAYVELHVVHTTPPVPHAEVLVPDTQVLPLQQPAHVAGSHTQVPPWHFWPVAHCAPEPHRQLPDAEQLSERVVEHVVHELPLVPQCACVGGL